jgi:hypothetical protein
MRTGLVEILVLNSITLLFLLSNLAPLATVTSGAISLVVLIAISRMTAKRYR